MSTSETNGLVEVAMTANSGDRFRVRRQQSGEAPALLLHHPAGSGDVWAFGFSKADFHAFTLMCRRFDDALTREAAAVRARA